MSCLQKHSYGFRAKVSDYGILRELDSRGFATPQCYPTLAHLAPEVLLHGKVSKVRPCPIKPYSGLATIRSDQDAIVDGQNMAESVTMSLMLLSTGLLPRLREIDAI